MYGCAGRGPAWSLAHLLPYSIAKPKAYSAPNVQRTVLPSSFATSISPVFSVSSRRTIALSRRAASQLVSAWNADASARRRSREYSVPFFTFVSANKASRITVEESFFRVRRSGFEFDMERVTSVVCKGKFNIPPVDPLSSLSHVIVRHYRGSVGRLRVVECVSRHDARRHRRRRRRRRDNGDVGQLMVSALQTLTASSSDG